MARYARRLIVWTAGVLLSLALLATLGIALFLWGIDPTVFRGRIERAATDALGRRVELTGALRWRPGLNFQIESLGGRIAAFNDAMEKLMWPEKRLGIQSIWTTSEDSEIPLESGYRLKVQKGTPVSLFASINAPQMQLLRNDNFFTRFIGGLIGRGLLRDVVLKRNLSPDFVVDRGHTFGQDLTDADKRALIEYVRTF